MNTLDNLSQAGYQKDPINSVWSKGSPQAFAYSDGDAVETRILKVLQNAKDLSLASSELNEHEIDWASTYHLSAARTNLLMPFKDAVAGKSVLEIGSGCGAITRFLGEQNCQVLALEGSARRAQITRERTRDLPNVQVLNESFANFAFPSQFDVITLIGVLEYSAMFTEGENPALNMLRRVVGMLRPNGTLYIAIENQLGLKYWAGVPEDHLAVPMVGLENTYTDKGVRTWGRKTLLELQALAGFGHVQLYCPFPDYKFPVTLIPQAAFEEMPVLSQRLVQESIELDPQINRQTSFSLPQVWATVQTQGLACDMSNSFLLVCKNEPFEEADRLREHAINHYSAKRLAGLRKQKLFHVNSTGAIQVISSPLFPGIGLQAEGVEVAWDRENVTRMRQTFGVETYQPEPTLQVAFRQVFNQANWSIEQVIAVARQLKQSLLDLAAKRPFSELQGNPVQVGPLVSGSLFDATPKNIVLGKDKVALIDEEWTLESPIELSYLLFRGLLLAFWEVKTVKASPDAQGNSYHTLMQRVFAAIAPELNLDSDRFLRYEAIVQKALALNDNLTVTSRKYYGSVSIELPAVSPAEVAQLIKSYEELMAQSVKKFAANSKSLEDTVAKQSQQINTFLGEYKRLEGADQRLQALLKSRSWKLTRPLRMLSKLAKLGTKSVHELLNQSNGMRGALALLRQKARTLMRLATGPSALSDSTPVVPAKALQQAQPPALPALPSQNEYLSWISQHEQTIQEHYQLARVLAYQRNMDHLLVTHGVILAGQAEAALDATLDSLRPALTLGAEVCLVLTSKASPGSVQWARRFEATNQNVYCIWIETEDLETQSDLLRRSYQRVALTAKGRYTTFCEAGDCYRSPTLTHWYAKLQAASDGEEPIVVYADHDQLDVKRQRSNPWFKPDWDAYLLQEQNYLGWPVMVRTDVLRTASSLTTQGLQDCSQLWQHELWLSVMASLPEAKVQHLPMVVLHRDTANEMQEGTLPPSHWLALATTSGQMDRVAAPQLRCGWRYRVPSPAPHVTLIIPVHNQYDLLKKCLDSILEQTQYSAYDILVVDNNSDDIQTLDYLSTLQAKHSRIQVHQDPSPFNYAAINNRAVKLAKGCIIGLMNSDVEVSSPHWLDEMVALAIRDDVGCVGAKLYYPDDTVQHAGVVLGQGGIAGHVHSRFPRNHAGYQDRLLHRQSYSAVTAAVMVVRKSIYEKLGGLDAKNLGVAYNDVDFCLRVKELGYHNIWTPYAELYHHESASRGLEDSPEKIARFEKERDYMKARWGKTLQYDPAYNVNLSLMHTDWKFAIVPRN
jgi:GT2 family glycosyltransferase/SAM-dependent methyltransferase